MLRAVSADTRQSLRESVLVRRRALTATDCRLWSERIQTAALELDHYANANVVALYSPVQNEVETSAILSDAIQSGKRVYYPKLSLGSRCSFAQIGAATELVPGPFGVLEPGGSQLLAPTDPGPLIVFIPGLLFDRHGNRLGRGGGWYDRALQELGGRRLYVGLAYEFQLVEALSTEVWDQRVQIIITEKNRIDCGAGRY